MSDAPFRVNPDVVEFARQVNTPEARRASKLEALKRATMALIEDSIALGELTPEDVTEVMHSVVGAPPLPADAEVTSVGFRPVNYDDPAAGVVLVAEAGGNGQYRKVEALISEEHLDFLHQASGRYLGALRRANQRAARLFGRLSLFLGRGG